MNEKLFPPMTGDRVIVRVPAGLPALMMDITREVLRNPAEEKSVAYMSIAIYLERLLADERGKDDLMDMVTNLNKTDEERYIDGLKESGYTIEQLDKLAAVIQREWKGFKSRTKLRGEPDKANDNEWTHEMITDDLIEMLKNFGISLKVANESAKLIQKTWRKYRKSISKSSATTRPVSKKSSIDYSLEEIDFEYDSDDMERVNVVRKGHRDYVPPIPDFIDDFDSFKDENTVDVMKNLKNISFENEDE